MARVTPFFEHKDVPVTYCRSRPSKKVERFALCSNASAAVVDVWPLLVLAAEADAQKSLVVKDAKVKEDAKIQPQIMTNTKSGIKQ